MISVHKFFLFVPCSHYCSTKTIGYSTDNLLLHLPLYEMIDIFANTVVIEQSYYSFHCVENSCRGQDWHDFYAHAWSLHHAHESLII